jgi:ABC-type multidrug transport system ATPase subunit
MIDKIIDFVGDDKILIYITRSTEDLEKFDRVFYFKKGHIVESGHWKDIKGKRKNNNKK